MYEGDSYQYSVTPVVDWNQYETLNTRQRISVEGTEDIFQVSQKMTDAEYEAFEIMVRDTLQNGSLTYQAIYFDGNAERTGTGRIVDGDYQAQYLGVDQWEVSFSLEIIDRDMCIGQEVYLLLRDCYANFQELSEVISAIDLVYGRGIYAS